MIRRQSTSEASLPGRCWGTGEAGPSSAWDPASGGGASVQLRWPGRGRQPPFDQTPSSMSRVFSLSFHASASGSASFFSVMFGHFVASSALSATYSFHFSGVLSSGKIALVGHAGSQAPQSMQSSGWMTRKFGPSEKQSTGHTSTQSGYLHLMQGAATM